MNNIEYVKVDGKLYKINTDFRVGIECNNIALDGSIGDYERALAIIYKLFGEEGLNCTNKGKLLELGIKYLKRGKEPETSDQKYELDFSKCEGLIKSSFKFDYKYDPYELEYLHLYDFYNDLENLSSSEFGTACALHRVTGVLEFDTSKIKDSKEVAKIEKAKKELREKYCIQKENKLSNKQKDNVANLYKQIGLWKGDT